MEIREIDNEEGFRGLREDWAALLKRSKLPNAFQTWEWLFTWWRHYKDKKRLLLLLAFNEQNTLVGIAPLYTHSRRFGIQVLETIEFIGLGETKNSEYLDFIIDENMYETVLKNFVSYLLQIKKVDALYFTNLRKEGGSLDILGKISGDLKLNVFIETNLSCPYIDLPETMDAFLKTIKPKQRGRLNNQKNKLYKNHDVEVLCWEDVETLDEGVDLLFSLHNKRFGERSLFSYDINRGFNNDIAAEFFKKGMLKLYFLKLDGEFAAVMYCFQFEKRLVYYQTGYHPKWLKESALKILIYNVVQQAIGCELEKFDFGRGLEEYKLEWTKIWAYTDDILIFPNGNTGWLYKAQKGTYNSLKKVFHFS